MSDIETIFAGNEDNKSSIRLVLLKFIKILLIAGSVLSIANIKFANIAFAENLPSEKILTAIKMTDFFSNPKSSVRLEDIFKIVKIGEKTFIVPKTSKDFLQLYYAYQIS